MSLWKRKNLIIFLVSIYVAAALIIWIYHYHTDVMKNAYLVNDDSLQQIFVFYKVDNKPFSAVSTIARYYLDCFPVGFKFLYQTSVILGIDPLYFSKILSAFLFFATLAAGAALGLKKAGIGGLTFMFTAVLVCEGFFERMAGGLPRAFAYPLTFLFAYGALSGKIIPLIVSVILSVLFYPPLAPFFGIYLGLVLLIPKKLGFLKIITWSWQKRIYFYCAVILTCLILIFPTVRSSMSWGPMLDAKALKTIPEMSLHGRYDALDRTPSPSFFQVVDVVRYQVFTLFNRPQGKGQIHVTGRYGIFFLLLCFLPWFICRREKVLPLTILWITVMCLYAMSSLVYPKLYIPTRLVRYVMPILFLVGVTLVIGESKHFISRFRAGKYVTTGVTCLVMIFGLIYAPSPQKGFPYDFKPIAPLYDIIRKLPADSMIVGWPDPVLDAVPLFSHRPILIGYETYQLFHMRYFLYVRGSMNDTIKFLFTDNKEEFKLFKEKYGISHVLFPSQIYQKCDSLHIFSPFTEEATNLCQSTRNPIIRSLDARHTIWSGSGYILREVKNNDQRGLTAGPLGRR